MIDTFQKIATRIRPLRYAAVALGLACLAALAFMVLVAPPSGEQNRYLMPAMVGFVWALSAYGFIDTFQAVPGKADRSRGFLARAGLFLYRGWFWFLAILFSASTLAALLLTFKLGAFWLGKYA
jgi:hypothetical protein